MSSDRTDWDRDEREALDGVADQLEIIRERHRNDPALDLLRAANADVLPEPFQERVAQHLSESAWSRAVVDGLEQADAAFDSASEAKLLGRVQREAARERRSSAARSWLRPVLIASAVAASAAIAWLFVRPTTTPDIPISTQAVPQAEQAPAFQLAFAKPDVRLSMAALTWRGGGSDNQLLADLKPAFDAYRQGDYASAEPALTALAARYPDTIEILFYQGISRLYLKDARGAVAALSAAEAVADGTFIGDVRYYRAVAEQHAGDTGEARTRLDALCREKGPESARACTSLADLESSSTAKP
jgi:hypothetical protein